MDKNTAVALTVIGVGGAIAWYLFSTPPQEVEAEADFYGGTPTANQIGDLSDAGFFDPNPSDYANKFSVPYFGNSPHNQTEPNPVQGIIDQISNARSGDVGCCAQSNAPEIFIPPSITQYVSQPPISLPVAPAEIPMVTPKRTLADMVRQSNMEVASRYSSWRV